MSSCPLYIYISDVYVSLGHPCLWHILENNIEHAAVYIFSFMQTISIQFCICCLRINFRFLSNCFEHLCIITNCVISTMHVFCSRFCVLNNCCWCYAKVSKLLLTVRPKININLLDIIRFLENCILLAWALIVQWRYDFGMTYSVFSDF